MNSLEFKGELFVKLNKTVKINSTKIAYIADGAMKRGELYQQAIRKFMLKLQNGLQKDTQFSWQEILYITNELSMSKYFFDELMDCDEFDTFIAIVSKYKKISIYKKLFYLYFNFYSTIKKEKNNVVFELYLRNILKNYNGKNRYIYKLVDLKDYIFGDLLKLFEFYGDDIEVLKKDMKLQDSFEFFKVLLNFKIIKELKSLKYDEENTKLFDEILDKKNIFFMDNLTLKEYVARYLLDVAMQEQLVFSNWQMFIIKLLGDPRSLNEYSSSMRSWNVVGQKRKEFFIRTLSKDDLKLFLEALSDSVSDTNYHYRKAFWMQFLDKVVFAKIMVGSDAYLGLNSKMKDKFKFSNSSYSTLSGNHSQSAIYIDFGAIKVIEFTHNGKARFYNACPINLQKTSYSGNELRAIRTNFIEAIAHIQAEKYSWQKRFIKLMNKYIKIDLTEQDVYIDEDKKTINKYRG